MLQRRALSPAVPLVILVPSDLRLVMPHQTIERCSVLRSGRSQRQRLVPAKLHQVVLYALGLILAPGIYRIGLGLKPSLTDVVVFDLGYRMN